MYIRRKVFSVYTDEYGEERYFSTNEIISEDDYVEAMFSDDSNAGYTAAGAAALGAGAVGGTIAYGKNLVDRVDPKNVSKKMKAIAKAQAKEQKAFDKMVFPNQKAKDKAQKALTKKYEAQTKAVTKSQENAAKTLEKFGKKTAKAGKWIAKNPKTAAAGAILGGAGLAGGLGYAAHKAAE